MTAHNPNRQPPGSPDGGKFAPGAGGTEADAGALNTAPPRPSNADADRIVERMQNLTPQQHETLREWGFKLMHDEYLSEAETRAHTAILHADDDGVDGQDRETRYSQYRADLDAGSANWEPSAGLIVANAALVAVHARDTGNLSAADWEKMTRPWEVIAGPIHPTEQGLTFGEAVFIDELNLPPHMKSKQATDTFERAWQGVSDAGLSEKLVERRITEVTTALETGERFGRPLTPALKKEFESDVVELYEARTTRGRSLKTNQDAVTRAVVDGETEQYGHDEVWTN